MILALLEMEKAYQNTNHEDFQQFDQEPGVSGTFWEQQIILKIISPHHVAIFVVKYFFD